MRITRNIQNLKCSGCAANISKQLGQIEGIDNLDVNVEEGSVSFDYQDDGQFEAVHKKLIAMGYPFDDDDNSLITKAKSYVSCAIGRMSD